jgi:hypothetical protein
MAPRSKSGGLVFEAVLTPTNNLLKQKHSATSNRG